MQLTAWPYHTILNVYLVVVEGEVDQAAAVVAGLKIGHACLRKSQQAVMTFLPM